MRTHREIIEGAGGYHAVRLALGMPENDVRPKYWFFRDSIPASYWKDLCDLKLTSADELALAAHRARCLKDSAA